MSYTTTPYEAKVRRVWHLEHLRAICSLLGSPQSEAWRRVLSVGCGTGVHLIPLACEYPETTFIGCDPEVEPLARGESFADSCGLKNLSFVEGTAADVDKEPFDLILVQGVYSWISPQQQSELLAECAQRLSPEGIMLLTHNVAPGWTIRRVVQQYLETIGIRRARDIPSAELDRARDELKKFGDKINLDSPYGALIRAEIKRILGESASYLMHEFLNPETSGEPLSHLVERSAEFGLSYLGDARFSRNPLPEGTGANRLEAAMARDFQRGIPYRESLFSRQAIRTNFPTIDKEALNSLSFGTLLVEDEEPRGDFRDPRGREFSFGVEEVSYGVLKMLASKWPRFVKWSELSNGIVSREEVLSRAVIELLNSELITIAYNPPQYLLSSTTVTAPPWLRWEIGVGSLLTNRLYEPVELGGFETMLLSAIVSGLTSVDGLIRLTSSHLAVSPEHRSLPRGVIEDTVREGLRTLARAGLVNEIVEEP